MEQYTINPTNISAVKKKKFISHERKSAKAFSVTPVSIC